MGKGNRVVYVLVSCEKDKHGESIWCEGVYRSAEGARKEMETQYTQKLEKLVAEVGMERIPAENYGIWQEKANIYVDGFHTDSYVWEIFKRVVQGKRRRFFHFGES